MKGKLNPRETALMDLKDEYDTLLVNTHQDHTLNKEFKIRGLNMTTESKQKRGTQRRSKWNAEKHKQLNLDGITFDSLIDFCQYMQDKYGHPIGRTELRIRRGWSEERCKLESNLIRKQGYSKSKIVITDLVTGEEFIFYNSKDKEAQKMFSLSTITVHLRTGKPTVPIKNSKYPNPCSIKRANS